MEVFEGANDRWVLYVVLSDVHIMLVSFPVQ